MTEREKLENILNGYGSYCDNESEYDGQEYTIDEAITKLEALMREARIEELEGLIDLDDDSKSLPFGNSLFTNHSVIEDRLATLTASEEKKND